MPPESIVAIASAVGEAGLGVLRFSGPQAVAAVGSLFRATDGRPFSAQPPRYLAHGAIVEAGGRRLDEVLAVRFPAPASYTGEDVAEVHAHGGAFHLQILLDAFLSAGSALQPPLRLARPGEFTQRAFVNGKLDLAEAEAVADLIHSGAALAHEAASRQLEGRLSGELNALRRALMGVLAGAEAASDFPEEEGQLPPLSEWKAALVKAADRMDALLATARTGRLLREGLRVALCGAPNAGKSSLLNALLGEARSIVHESPGTTRDVIEAPFQVQGFPMVLVDCAGLREAVSEVEAEGVRRSLEQVELSDLRLLLLDQSAPLDAGALAGLDLGKGDWLVVLTKADLTPAWGIQEAGRALGGQLTDGVMRVSARKGDGLEALRQRLFDAAMGGRGPSVLQESLLTRARHEHSFRRARTCVGEAQRTLAEGGGAELLAGDLRGALEALGEIVGASTRAEVLEEIFRRFCVGK